MTNLEYMIAALTDQIDDGGSCYEAAVHYNIACPHFLGEQNLPCDRHEPSREICVPCKVEWLNKEIDGGDGNDDKTD